VLAEDTVMSQLDLLVESVTDYAIALLDIHGHILTWNRGAEKIYGYTPDNVISRSVAVLYEDSRKLKERLSSARNLGSSTTTDWRVRKDGTRLWVRAVYTALFDPPGTLCGFGEISEDCTESRQTNDMFRSVTSSLRSHIAVVDASATILVVNDAWNRFAVENGASVEAVGVGVNYMDICRRATGERSEEAYPAQCGLDSVLKRSVEEFTLEYPCPAPDVERWFLMSITPWGLDGGGAVVSHTDITERVLAEQRLRSSEAHYRSLIENEVDVVSILKPDGTICFESPALEPVLGYRPEELVGKNAFDYIHPNDLPVVKEEIANTLRTSDASRPVEFAFRHKDGSWRTLESVARNLLANPTVQGIIVDSRDITPRRKAEAELREKEAALKSSHEQLQALTGRLLEAEERERRRLSRELHDDLNQKLAVLAVDLGSLGRSVRNSSPEAVEQSLRDMQVQLVKVSDEVRIMAYQLHPSILDHLGLAVALRSYCSEFSKRENIHVKLFHRNVSTAVAPGVATCLYRITQEALRNVAKHAKTNRASVSIVGSTDFVTLTIRDWGVGFQSDEIKSQISLGLTSMTERARQIGGELNIESTPGKGTTLTVRIPWPQGESQ
jgi:PAS domain S-box-containing protein